MAKGPRIVAELGRPETPAETASRKAESSRAYRASQNTRNLVAALLATLAVVAVIVFAVPRGEPAPAAPIEVAAEAESVAAARQRTVIAPDAPEDWRVNRAYVDTDDSVNAWTVIYAPPQPDRAFLRIAQGFDADPAWPTRVLTGAAAPSETVTVRGVAWDRYELDPSRSGNVNVALSTSAGPDTVLIYGLADDDTIEQAAAAVAAQVLQLREEAQ